MKIDQSPEGSLLRSLQSCTMIAYACRCNCALIPISLSKYTAADKVSSKPIQSSIHWASMPCLGSFLIRFIEDR